MPSDEKKRVFTLAALPSGHSPDAAGVADARSKYARSVLVPPLAVNKPPTASNLLVELAGSWLNARTSPTMPDEHKVGSSVPLAVMWARAGQLVPNTDVNEPPM